MRPFIHLRLVAGIVLIAIAGISTVTRPETFRATAVLALALCVLCLAVTAGTQARGAWSVPFLALLMLVVFHAGALPEYLVRGVVFEHTRYAWGGSEVATAALWVSCIAIVGFTVGALIASRWQRSSTIERVVPLDANVERSSVSGVAFVILLFCISIWLFQTVVIGGLTPLSSSYEDYLESPASLSSVWLFQPIGVAFTLLAIRPSWRLYKYGVGVFAVFAFVAFFAGFRGEVLFAVAAHMGLLAYRRKMPSAIYVIAGITVVLAGSAIARGVRETGLRAANLDALTPRPFDGLSELGFTQYVVEVVTGWQKSHGEEVVGGLTYYAPLERLLFALTGTDRVDGASDLRLFNVLIQSREGPVGGSVIGEALHNFGALGAVVLVFMVGFLISLLAARAYSDHDLAVLGILSFAFYWHVRNASTPLALLLGTSLAALILLGLFDRNLRASDVGSLSNKAYSR